MLLFYRMLRVVTLKCLIEEHVHVWKSVVHEVICTITNSELAYKGSTCNFTTCTGLYTVMYLQVEPEELNIIQMVTFEGGKITECS